MLEQPLLPRRRFARCAILAVVSLAISGAVAADSDDLPTLRYVGSSTVGNFIGDAQGVYGRARFVIDTEPESAGGEEAILAGVADVAGVAARPREATLAKGVVATLIGRDAIAVIVHPKNPVSSLTIEQLRGIFAGDIRNWKEVGGQDAAIRPVIVSPASATRKIFRSVVLQEADYARCEIARPDGKVIETVAGDPATIGQISFSFLSEKHGVRALRVAGQEARADNLEYPITRPLYLLWWPGRDAAAEFAAWARSEPGQRTVMRRFVGIGSLGKADVEPKSKQ